MRPEIKKYGLKENITEEDLKKCGFTYSIDGSIKKITTPRYFYFKYLIDEIELFVEIGINEDGTFTFDDFDTVMVLDDDFCQPYTPFYKEDADFPFSNSVIIKYNEAMDELVSKGILSVKIDKELVEENNLVSKGNSRKRK